jgi:hypothetical protein
MKKTLILRPEKTWQHFASVMMTAGTGTPLNNLELFN